MVAEINSETVWSRWPSRWQLAAVAAMVLWATCCAALAQEPVAESIRAETPIDERPIAEAPITDGDRAHWAFGPVVRPPLPTTKDAAWARNSVDTFVLAKLERAKLTTAEEASRATLLRRVAFDLTGLPPTREEIAAFEADRAPDAYERLVDRLLASPAFGERYAQHWLELARFAETDGFEHDKLRPDAWQYRDWVIAALNGDMPYDEFVRLQIAGDQAADDQAASGAVATMFCLAGPDMPDINDQAERRHNRLNELTATVGSVFLGLQLGCAQCHDHKYDPLSQADFYRLRAVFEPAMPALKRDVACLVLANQAKAAPARFWIRGDHRRPGLEVMPAFPRIASPLAASNLNLNAEDFRPRAHLADWLTGAGNPLTSRVMANRLWQHHFGRGIVESPSDFGLLGAAPTHPELLDWLAIELREQSWSMKRLHRAIVGSATYRQSSTAAHQPPSDPENRLYCRFPRRRLDGEALRDSLLSAAGLLSSERGGPGVMPPLPQELVATLLKGQWKTSEREGNHYRRSIYVFARRNLRYPLFEAFDRPDGNASCAARSRSTTAPQSLLLLNSELTLLAARHLAARLIVESDEPGAQIERLFLQTYGREPVEAESRRLLAFLAAQREQLAAAGADKEQLALPATASPPTDSYTAAALVDLCLAIFNSSEFVYCD